MACPIAAGAAALLLQQDPTLQPWQLRNLLINNTDSDGFTGTVPNDTWGYGKLNIEKALEANLPGEIVTQTVNSTGSYSFSGTDISMNFSVNGTNGFVAATEVNNIPVGGTGNVGGSLHHVSSIRYWQIETDKTGFTTSITFDYDPVTDGIQDENTLRIARRENDGDTWMEYVDITRAPGSDQITANNVTGFSQWIFASELGDNALPVTLTNFSCEQIDKKIQINWTTESELENFGFNLYRAEKQKDTQNNNLSYEKINSEIIIGAGNSSAPHDYTVEDLNVEHNKTYLYLLEDVSFSGEISQSHPVEILFKAPLKFALYQNFPNPFNPGTNIEYTLGVHHDVPTQVTLQVYDISGREVKTLVNKRQNPGKYTFTFDATNLAGGIYIYKLKAGPFEQIRKMVLLK